MEQCSIQDVRLLAGGEDGLLQHLPLNDPLDDGSADDQNKTPWDVILNFLTSKPLETTAKVKRPTVPAAVGVICNRFKALESARLPPKQWLTSLPLSARPSQPSLGETAVQRIRQE